MLSYPFLGSLRVPLGRQILLFLLKSQGRCRINCPRDPTFWIFMFVWYFCGLSGTILGAFGNNFGPFWDYFLTYFGASLCDVFLVPLEASGTILIHLGGLFGIHVGQLGGHVRGSLFTFSFELPSYIFLDLFLESSSALPEKCVSTCMSSCLRCLSQSLLSSKICPWKIHDLSRWPNHHHQ